MAIHFADEMNLKYNDLEKNKILKISMTTSFTLEKHVTQYAEWHLNKIEKTFNGTFPG